MLLFTSVSTIFVFLYQDNNIDGVIDHTFSIDFDRFGVQITVDLCENGRNRVVTNDNKVYMDIYFYIVKPIITSYFYPRLNTFIL